VHSHIDHLKALVAQAKEEGVRAVRIHALLDGRDVPETSALDYVEPFEAFLAGLNGGGFDARIASGGGRQNITMDRYEANWALVEKGWRVHVLGEGDQFPIARPPVRALREKHPGTIDQDLPPFVIAAGGQPVGTVEDGDAVVFFNFRGDRAIEITRAFEEADFDKFDRVRQPRVDLCRHAAVRRRPQAAQALPGRSAGDPRHHRRVVREVRHRAVRLLRDAEVRPRHLFLERQPLRQVRRRNLAGGAQRRRALRAAAVDEGRRDRRRDDRRAENRQVPHPALQFRQRRHGRPYRQFPRRDDGHRGRRPRPGALLAAVDAAGGVALITADHGNADEMYEIDKKTKQPATNPDGSYKAKTSHTLNPVPLILYDNASGGRLGLRRMETAGLSNIAATTANLLGFEKHAAWDDSLLTLK
jgi:2,3-bisphosphoglycerate-independent phosphoglycerate mutase